MPLELQAPSRPRPAASIERRAFIRLEAPSTELQVVETKGAGAADSAEAAAPAAPFDDQDLLQHIFAMIDDDGDDGRTISAFTLLSRKCRMVALKALLEGRFLTEASPSAMPAPLYAYTRLSVPVHPSMRPSPPQFTCTPAPRCPYTRP
mgnify:CR=1 FL=1